MECLISEDSLTADEKENAPLPAQPQSNPTTVDVPLTIPTPASATAPRGHIIDDSARGTIFWEAGSGNLDPNTIADAASAESGDTSGEESASRGGTAQPNSNSFGKPFEITWQSTERLPFYRTRGLRNPWNANREVKIARDGTELEPSVGRKLIGMFEQQAQINLAARTAGPPQQYGYPQQVVHYPTMMPQGQFGYSPQGHHSYGRPY